MNTNDAPVVGAADAAPTSDPAGRRRGWWQYGLGLALGLALAWLMMYWPSVSRVTARSGRTYDVISLDRHVGRTLGRGTPGKAEHSLLLEYYAATTDTARQRAEAADLAEIALPITYRTGDSRLVIRQVRPILSRYSGLTVSRDIHYRKVSESEWRREH